MFDSITPSIFSGTITSVMYSLAPLLALLLGVLLAFYIISQVVDILKIRKDQQLNDNYDNNDNYDDYYNDNDFPY